MSDEKTNDDTKEVLVQTEPKVWKSSWGYVFERGFADPQRSLLIKVMALWEHVSEKGRPYYIGRIDGANFYIYSNESPEDADFPELIVNIQIPLLGKKNDESRLVPIVALWQYEGKMGSYFRVHLGGVGIQVRENTQYKTKKGPDAFLYLRIPPRCFQKRLDKTKKKD